MWLLRSGRLQRSTGHALEEADGHGGVGQGQTGASEGSNSCPDGGFTTLVSRCKLTHRFRMRREPFSNTLIR